MSQIFFIKIINLIIHVKYYYTSQVSIGLHANYQGIIILEIIHNLSLLLCSGLNKAIEGKVTAMKTREFLILIHVKVAVGN